MNNIFIVLFYLLYYFFCKIKKKFKLRKINYFRYYPALKILEQLEHTYLPRISRYRFAQTMKAAIPVHREKIKEASKSDLNDFLENVRRISPMIGEKAMKHVSILFYDI